MKIRHRSLALFVLVAAMMASGFSPSGTIEGKLVVATNAVAESAPVTAVVAKGDLLLPRKS